MRPGRNQPGHVATTGARPGGPLSASGQRRDRVTSPIANELRTDPARPLQCPAFTANRAARFFRLRTFRVRDIVSPRQFASPYGVLVPQTVRR